MILLAIYSFAKATDSSFNDKTRNPSTFVNSLLRLGSLARAVSILKEKAINAGLLDLVKQAEAVESSLKLKQAKIAVSNLDPASRLILNPSSASAAAFFSLIEKAIKDGKTTFFNARALTNPTSFETFLIGAKPIAERSVSAEGVKLLSMYVVDVDGSFNDTQRSRLAQLGITVIDKATYDSKLAELSKEGKEASIVDLEASPELKPQRPSDKLKYIAIKGDLKGVISGLRAVWASVAVFIYNKLATDPQILHEVGLSKEDLDNLLHPQADGSFLSNAAPLGTDKELDEYLNQLEVLGGAT